MPLAFSLGFPFFNAHENRLKISLSLQSAVMLISMLLMHDGAMDTPNPFHFFLLSVTAYWLSVAIIMVRRNGNATRLDQFLLAWGYPVMILLTGLVASIVPFGLLRHH